MKSKLMQAAAGTILGLMILIGGTHREAFGQRVENAPTIEGVWRNQVTVRDCQSSTVLATFSGLLTYHQGGTISETTATFFRSPGYGIWNRTRGRNYTGKFTFFTFNPDGTPSGSQKVNQNIVISLDGNNLTDTATAEIYDTGGNLLITVCASANATRFE